MFSCCEEKPKFHHTSASSQPLLQAQSGSPKDSRPSAAASAALPAAAVVAHRTEPEESLSPASSVRITMSEDALRAAEERAAATKELLERQLADRRREAAERRERRLALQRAVAAEPDAEKKKLLQAEFESRERDILREARKRYSPSDFESLVTIGRGAFGEVTVVRGREDGRIYAMKRMLKDAMLAKNQVAHVMAERAALSEVGEAGGASAVDWVVRLHFSFQDASFLYLVMDLCVGGDLMGLLIKRDTLPEEMARFYAAEMAMAIASVHSAGFIHRDIKPDNFLFDHRGHLYLTDLGLCKAIEEDEGEDGDEISEAVRAVQREGTGAGAPPGGLSPPLDSHHDRPGYVRDRKLAYSTVGTPDYIDYQVLLKKGYGREADWWSYGTVLYECILGYPPFWGSSPVETCRKILRYKESLKFPEDRTRHLSPACIDFLRRLIGDADTRLGARGGLAEIQAHPWFAGFDWSNIRAREAPYQPPNGRELDSLLAVLGDARASREQPAFSAALKRLTACFDDFENLAADDPRHAFPGGGHGAGGGAAPPAGSKIARRFVGYTYKRTPDGRLGLGGRGGGAAGGAGGSGGT